MNYVCLVAMQLVRHRGLPAFWRATAAAAWATRASCGCWAHNGSHLVGGGYYGHRENNGKTPWDGGPLRINLIYIYTYIYIRYIVDIYIYIRYIIVGIYWGPYPLLKGSNRGVKQLGYHPKGTTFFPMIWVTCKAKNRSTHRREMKPCVFLVCFFVVEKSGESWFQGKNKNKQLVGFGKLGWCKMRSYGDHIMNDEMQDKIAWPIELSWWNDANLMKCQEQKSNDRVHLFG